MSTPVMIRRWSTERWRRPHVIVAGSTKELCGEPVDCEEPPPDDREWGSLTTGTLARWHTGGDLCGRCLRIARYRIAKQEAGE